MSILSEINRITNEVTDQTALIAQLIEAVEGKAAGGGGVVTGTFTPASASALTITHNLGKQPNFVALFVTSQSASALKTKWKMCTAIGSRFAETIQLETYNNGSSGAYYLNSKDTDPAGEVYGNIIKKLDDTAFTYACYEGELSVGDIYRWVVA